MKQRFEFLELGAGDRYTKGFARQDIDPDNPDLDLVCPAEEIDQYVEAGSVKKLRATHLLEHFLTNQVHLVLDSWFKVLAPGGELYLEVPNFAWHAKLVLEGKDEEAVNYAFGGQLDIYDQHKTGFTPYILSKALLSAGFGDIELEEGTSMTVYAYKPM